MTSAFIRRLSLANFRSYHAAQIELAPAGPVVLTGANGAGKTNLIEAISLLAPGRGLRRATMEELAFSEGDGAWAVSAEIEGMLGLATLGTGIDPPAGEDSGSTRKCRVDRESVGSAAAFADHLRVVWLTPAMDPLFNGPASERRRFLDRLVLAVDAQHSSRVAALERSLRSRNRLLEDPRSDPHWLDAIEHETAEVAVAVAAARAETVGRLAGALAAGRDRAPEFPDAEIALEGWMEQLLPQHSAREIEDRYRALLKDNRARDAAAGRTLDGPHLSDLAVTPCRQGHSGIRHLDRRAEGAADPPGARPCRADQGHDRFCAALAARRGHRPSRSGAPRRALRRAGEPRRAGLDDRRRSGRLRRHCRPRAGLRGARRRGGAAVVAFHRLG